MAYNIYNSGGEDITSQNLQNKGPWCLAGASFEEVFINVYGERLGLIINPEKATNIYAPDLLKVATNNVGDLKTQNTPFFQAGPRFRLNPQYTVTFNLKDYQRYLQNYPTIEIYFWVSWIATRFVGSSTIEVEPMEGIWFAPFANIIEMVRTAPIHAYQQRVSDHRGNAKDSYVFNLQNELFTRLF